MRMSRARCCPRRVRLIDVVETKWEGHPGMAKGTRECAVVDGEFVLDWGNTTEPGKGGLKRGVIVRLVN